MCQGLLIRSICALALCLLAATASAQRARENAVAEANDAFGTAVGREEIGLYSANSARGFSPSQAGNLRVDGLYFDQINQAKFASRIVRGSSVHVGISAQGFAFPAPTGVVDFHLRTPGEESAASVLLGVASYDQWYGELDFQTPVIDDVLSIGGGAGYSRNSSYRIAEKSEETTFGAIALWQPAENLTIKPFWSWSEHLEFRERPYVFIGNSGYPRYRAVDLMAQPWTDYGFTSANYGVTAELELAEDWELAAGVFRSEAQTNLNYEPSLLNTNGEERGDYLITASPPRESHSTSGEVRLSRKFAAWQAQNLIYMSVRGRDRSGESGGADTQALGPATTSQVPLVPPLEFAPGATTRIDAQQLTPGIGYEGIWRDAGQISLGVQKSYYERTVYAPGAAPIAGESEPWIYYLAGAWYASQKLAVYASFTRGFEEIGNAPFNAANRDEVVPAQLTKQVDAGIRYQLTPSLQLVAGAFEIEKPYFDLDELNFFRHVGTTSNRGLELSLTGALTQRLTVVAGIIAIDPKVSYDTGQGSEERTAVGPVPGLVRANFQYRLAAIEGLTLDAKIESTSKRYARYNSVRLPAATTVDAGVRYDTQVLGRDATFRLQLFNLTNEYSLTPNASGQLTPLDARRFDLSFAFDI
jgi:iron complex outermembrane recepter protein